MKRIGPFQGAKSQIGLVSVGNPDGTTGLGPKENQAGGKEGSGPLLPPGWVACWGLQGCVGMRLGLSELAGLVTGVRNRGRGQSLWRVRLRVGAAVCTQTFLAKKRGGGGGRGEIRSGFGLGS